MAIVVSTGTTDATQVSRFSACSSYKGVHSCTAVAFGPTPYAAIFGGRTQAAGTPSPANLPTTFRVLSTSVLADGPQVTYEWRRNTTAPIANNVEHAAAVGLADGGHPGQILVCGGHSDWETAHRDTTLFSWSLLPVETWSIVASGLMSVGRAGHALTSLLDGRVLATGGMGAWNTPLASAEAWDPLTGTWSGVAAMSEPRQEHRALLRADGTVLVAGGRRPFVPFAADAGTFALWHLDEGTGVTTAAEPVGGLTLNTTGSTAGLAAKGGSGLRVGAAAPASAGARQTTLNAALLGEWTIEGWMSAHQGTVACNGAAAAGDANNVTLCVGIDGTNHLFWYWQVAGGASVTGTSTAVFSSVMPHADTLTHPFLYHVAWVKSLAASHLAGKYDVTLYVNGVQLQVWTDQTNAAGGGSGVVQLGADVKGTYPAFPGFLDEVRLSSVARGAGEIAAAVRTQAGVMNFDDPQPALAQLQGLALASSEVWNGTTWTRSGSMGEARYGHVLVGLPNGEVLAAGGAGGRPGTEPVPLATAEVWSPVSGRWRPAGRMAAAREQATAAVLPGGLVAVTGGAADGSVDLYNPTTGRWRHGMAALSAPRAGALSFQVGGVWVVAGGTSPVAGTLDTTELSHVLVPGAEAVAGGGADGMFPVASVPGATTFTYQTSVAAAGGLAGGVVPTATPAAAVAGPETPGPFAWDGAGAAVTAAEGTVAVRLDGGRGHPSVALSGVLSALAFPDAPGWLAFRFGRTHEIRPVPYLGRQSGTELRLDASYALPYDVVPGDTVTLLSGQGPPPAPTAAQGAFYATATPAALGAVLQLAEDVVAGGIDLHRTVLFPGDRGLGAEGAPTQGARRLSGVVQCFADDPVDAFVENLREEA